MKFCNYNYKIKYSYFQWIYNTCIEEGKIYFIEYYGYDAHKFVVKLSVHVCSNAFNFYTTHNFMFAGHVFA